MKIDENINKMNDIELAVIVNSFNRLALLKGSLLSLCEALKNSGFKYSVVIFDANSQDGSLEWIKDFIIKHKDGNVFLVGPAKDEPDTFSFGVNAASDFAIKKYPQLKYLLFYETDNVIFSSEPLINAQRLLEENVDLAACGFTVKKHNGESAGFACSFPTITSFVLGQQLSFFLKLNKPLLNWQKKPYAEFLYADVVYTSPLLIKKEVWEKVQGFDSVHFPFSDCDIDLAYRISKAGQKMAVLKTIGVIHDNLDKASLWSSKRTINFYRARLTYFKKHAGQWVNLLKPMLFMMHLFELFLLFALFMFGKRKRHSLKSRMSLIKSVFVNYR